MDIRVVFQGGAIVSFALRAEESLQKGIRRIARKELEYVHAQVTRATNGSRDTAVHEARKSCKKLRALLRLVRPAINARTYQDENSALRDTARPLTQVRDAKVLVETLDKLSQHFSKRVRGQPFASIRKALLAYQREVRKYVLDEDQAFTRVETAVRDALARLEGWATIPDRWSSVGHGVQQVYRQARRALAVATAEPTVEHFHEWRKQVKYLRYQLTILQPIWPEIMEPLVDQAAHLGELLGEDHDLAVLRQLLTDDPERFGGDEARELLFALLDHRRQELEEEAIFLGQRFFQDSPKVFARRLKGYWTTWRDLRQQKDTHGAQGELHP